MAEEEMATNESQTMYAAEFAEMKAEIEELRAEIQAVVPEWISLPPPLEPLVMEKAKFGRESVDVVKLDRGSVALLAEKHGKLVYVDARKGRYFALPDSIPDEEETRFYVGGWYVERDGRNPGWMTDEEFQAAKG